jgi:NAD(P)-dependent dehydrogenase (short-subunit alcohol dehydrogenase family)
MQHIPAMDQQQQMASADGDCRILVTGANKGIGYAMCKKLLETQPQVHVLLGARDQQKGQRAVNSLLAEVPSAERRLEFILLDVTSDRSVRTAASALASKFGASCSLWGLVNNAGIASGRPSDILNVNVYGVKRVCEAFLPLLNPQGRVVNISSGVGPGYVRRCSAEEQTLLCHPAVTWQALERYIQTKSGGRDNPYGLSKALLNAYTILLARENPGIAINACSPGYIRTDLTGGMGGLPPEAGTRAAMKLLFSELEGNGRYYGSDGLRSPLHLKRDPGEPEYKGP